MPRTNADLTLELLEAAGVDVIFTCPGTTEVPLLDASVRHRSPRFVLTTHETATVSAADAYSRATGKLGVALLHANVGLTNGLAMVEAARIGRSRVLVLNGTKPTSTRNRRGFTQTAESTAVAAPFVVQATSVTSLTSVEADIRQALQRLHNAPSGPVYLELPQDLLAMPASGGTAPVTFTRPATVADDAAIVAVASQLADARRVLVVAGSDLAAAGATPLAVELAESLGAPIMEAPWRELERETVPTSHPSYAGLLSYGAHALEDAVIVITGTPAFQEPDDGPGLLPPSARVVHILDHAADLMPGSTPLVGDYVPTLARLIAAVRRSAADGRQAATERRQFLAEVTAWHHDSLQQLGSPTRGDDGQLTVLALAAELQVRPLPGPIVLDAVTATSTLFRLTPRGPGRELYATGSGALGWGLGAAVGVAMAGRYDRVFGVVSDGVVQFGLPALHTAVAEQLPVTFIVVNNQAYHAVALALRKFGGSAADNGCYPCTDLGGTDLTMVAAGFGLRATRVTSIDELRAALDDQGSVEGPALIEVVVPADASNPAR
ncbi:thiamine pyrophosphate-binding protein [Georgenia sp. AZ-5]|uniref:thiamine pyrophosphate-binding protein n=1 Tax=Georgenia sp. AZ-5 TaxID=3367526 RepID=UPI0037543B09